jgi:hypothetical protein
MQMKSLIEIAEITVLMGLMFSFALLVEWGALQLFFSAISAGLRPAVVPAREFAERRTQH